MSDALSRDSRSSAVWPLRIACSVGVIVLVRWLLVSNEAAVRSISPKCLIHQTTGFHCPGCGATRATFALLKGDVFTSWRMNPYFTLLLAGAAAYGAVFIFAKVSGRDEFRAKLGVRSIWFIFVTMIIFGVLRNIPHYPFTLLAPR